MSQTDLFIITSVINTGNIPWSYCSVRSAFSVEDRFKQTLHTIQSIRDRKDHSAIMLVECSYLSQEMEEILMKSVDYYIQCYKNDDIRLACINNGLKGYGEAMKTLAAVQYINLNQISFQRIFKISGRYYLDSFFSKDSYSLDQYSFKLYNNVNGSTVLYSVPYCLIEDFEHSLKSIITIYQKNGARGYETLLPIMCNPKKLVDTLGVCGYVAIPDPITGVPGFYQG